MGDWFETRFREPVDTGELDPEFARRMHALVLTEWEAEDPATPPTGDLHTFDDPEGDIIMIETQERPALRDPESPRRRSPGSWLLVAAAVAVIAVIGALLVVDGDEGEDKVGTVATNPDQGSGTTPTAEAPRAVPDGEEFVALAEGPYFVDPDGDPSTPLRVTFDVTEIGWVSWLGAAKMVGADHVVLTITTIDNLTRDACRDEQPQTPAVGPTVDDLVGALTRLAPFEVSAPPTDVTIQGYRGKHVQLRVPNEAVSGGEFVGCVDGDLNTWFSPLHDNGKRAFYGYNGEPGRTEDFYILDVEGTRLVLITMVGPKSRPQDVAELDAMFESIKIEP